MKFREAMRLIRDANIPDWQCEEVKVPDGWNSTGVLAWRSSRAPKGRDVSSMPVAEWFSEPGEPVKVIGECYCDEFETTLYAFRDGSVFGVNSRLLPAVEGLELRGIRTATRTIMLAGVKNGRNEILIAERRVQ